jgi:hypothetical protein
MDRNKDETTSSNDAPAKKKPYQAPALVDWGTLRDLTQAINGTAGLDSTKKGTSRRTR